MMRGAMLMGHPGGMFMFVGLGILGLILLVVAIVLLIRNGKKKKVTETTDASVDATETVRMLYAKGEIDEEEFKKRVAVLEGKAVFTADK